MKVGDIVKVVETLATTKSNGETIFISTNERFVVFNLMGGDAQIRSLGRTLEIVIGRRFLEVQPKPKERKSLGKVSFNPTPKLSKQDILTLIDIAIDTGDKEWFNELHSELSTLA